MAISVKKVTISEIESRQKEVGGQLLEMKNTREINLRELVTKQDQAKSYQKVLDKKYKPLTRDPDALKEELEKMTERLNSIRYIEKL